MVCRFLRRQQDISIVCARWENGSDHWSEPVQVSYDSERSEQNPSLFKGPDGAVWCMYTAQLDRMEGKDNMQFTSIIRCQKSFDGGKTWGEAEVIFPEEGSFCRQPIQVLSNGRWIFGNWICTDSVMVLKAIQLHSVFQMMKAGHGRKSTCLKATVLFMQCCRT